MAASMWRMNGLCGRMAAVLVLCTLLLSNEVMCQDVIDSPTDNPPAIVSTHAPVIGNSTTANRTSDDAPSTAVPEIPASPQPETVSTTKVFTDLSKKSDDRSASISQDSSEPDKKTSKGSSSSVFVGILVTGLLVALALIIGYFKCQRKPDTKGVRLAEEACPADQENQGNTLESVAPLNPPPETQDKPNSNVNGESPEAPKTQPPPPTNGHSTAKTADTEL